jgi:TPR repeat protein
MGMNRTFKVAVAAFVLAVRFAGSAAAGPFEDADAAFWKANAAFLKHDYATAVSWYRKAAELGDATAQQMLGHIYEDGSGVPKDYETAASWYRKAADQGDADAQYQLGVMYENGMGVPRDYVLAHMWLNLAAAQQHFIVAGLERDYLEKT